MLTKVITIGATTTGSSLIQFLRLQDQRWIGFSQLLGTTTMQISGKCLDSLTPSALLTLSISDQNRLSVSACFPKTGKTFAVVDRSV